MQADQINCLNPLEILNFLLDLASRQGLPVYLALDGILE